MKHVTKTINPLHFEDLEPHRFEDLVRQLAYDFRNWSSLEATGRSGADEGFDARGREIVPKNDEEEDEIEEETRVDERIWLIQCKREKSITPKRIEKYLDECLEDKDEQIYGILFVAPCDLSKKSRDTFITKIREHGIEEFQIWSKGELEDILFQPKNDHLLFAYFQISLKVHRRSLRTRIRSTLSIKRKAIRVLGNINVISSKPVLIRDPDADVYPYTGEVPDFDIKPLWRVYEFSGHYHGGLTFRVCRYFAYLRKDNEEYDFAHAWNDAWCREDVWNKKQRNRELRNQIWKFWEDIPELEKGWLDVECLLPYENIIAIDEDGDKYVQNPHIYAPFSGENGPFKEGQYLMLRTIGFSGRQIQPDWDNRIEYFPKEYREKP